MPTIDSENAKQIRQPMDVLITMSLASDDVSMTYSGYSTAKVADGKLDQRSWSMRKLADLQGDGFPLDGSCVLYNANTQPSQANGKLGVRSNVGESVSVTATGSKVMASLTVLVTGAESVTYNGVTASISGNYITIPVLATSISMTFAPESQTERIEISAIYPDAEFRITNDNLIRATVSLRSDLSPYDQTLPESEINIEVYHSVDISEDVANIPADTPIIYQAGYEGDMSPERKFYVSGQVTWADNVLTIQGVDAVHFLDYNTEVAWWLQGVYGVPFIAERVLKGARAFAYEDDAHLPYSYRDFQIIIPPGKTGREILAILNWAFRIRGATASLQNRPMWFKYTDAGIPSLYFDDSIPLSGGTRILEEDCSDITKNPEVPIQAFNTYMKDVIRVEDEGQNSPLRMGTGEWVKNVGVSLSFEKLCDKFVFGVDMGDNFDSPAAAKLLDYYGAAGATFCVSDVGPGQKDGTLIGYSDWGSDFSLLFTSDVTSESYERLLSFYEGNPPYVAFIPWGAKFTGTYTVGNKNVTSMNAAWNAYKNAGVMDPDSISLDLTICGDGFETYDSTKLINGGVPDGDIIEIDSPLWGKGRATGLGTLFPNGVYESRLQDSNITGSFTWKGDPRMQPRDIVEWERLDGTIETITLENITLTHEGGGTSAEITYRKGVV